MQLFAMLPKLTIQQIQMPHLTATMIVTTPLVKILTSLAQILKAQSLLTLMKSNEHPLSALCWRQCVMYRSLTC